MFYNNNKLLLKSSVEKQTSFQFVGSFYGQSVGLCWNGSQVCCTQPNFMSKEAAMFVPFSCQPLYEPINTRQTNQLTKHRTRETYTSRHEGCGAHLTVYLWTSRFFWRLKHNHWLRAPFQRAIVPLSQRLFTLIQEFVVIMKPWAMWKTKVTCTKLKILSALLRSAWLPTYLPIYGSTALCWTLVDFSVS
jgi:hypothetical protein